MVEVQRMLKWTRYTEIIFGVVSILAAITCWLLFAPLIFRPPEIYIPGTLCLLAPPVILFGSLWLARPYINQNISKLFRGWMAVLGIVFITLGVTAFHIDSYRIFSLRGDYPGIIGLIELQVTAVLLITTYLMIIFLLESISWSLLVVTSNPLGWFKSLGILLGIIEFILTAIALIIPPTILFLTLIVILIDGVILVLKFIAGQ